MKKLYLVSLLLLWVCTIGEGASVALGWDVHCDNQVAGYVVYYGPPAAVARTNVIAAYTNDCGVYMPTTTNVYRGNYTNTVYVTGRTNTTTTITNLVNGATYCIALVARTDIGVESDLSNELSFTVPLKRPKSLLLSD